METNSWSSPGNVDVVRAIPMVGRKDVVNQILNAIQDKRTYVIHISGEGGIGKTLLLQHILDHCMEHADWLAVKYPVDLYHTRNHSPEELMSALANLFPEEQAGFKRYHAEQKKLDQFSIQRPERGREIFEQRAKVREAFLKDFNRLAKKKRVILALDTAERLYFQEDPTAERLGMAQERPAVLEWLLSDFLPRLKNTVVLIAGRPRSDVLQKSLEKIPQVCSVHIALKPLTESETLEYFDRLAEQVAEHAPRTAEYIHDSLSPDQRKATYYYLCDYDEQGQSLGVRPILLSLVIDYQVMGGEAYKEVPELKKPLEEVLGMTIAERQKVRQVLEEKLLGVFFERPPDEYKYLPLLGLATKGMDAELLAALSGDIKYKEAEEHLEKLGGLSFVKIRVPDRRVFLHDEMYDLLRQKYYEPRGQTQHFDEGIGKYYPKRIRNAEEEINQALAAVPIDQYPQKAIEARDRLWDARTEDLHYKLRQNLESGFVTYFLYQEEIVTSGDYGLEQQLRAELYGFLAEERLYAQRQGDQARVEEIDRLVQTRVIPDSATRWVKRFFYRRQPDIAHELCERLNGDCRDLITPGGELVLTDFHSIEGPIYTNLGYYQQTNEALNITTIQKLEALDVAPMYQPMKNAILARAYNNLGLIARKQGRMRVAEEAYRHALPYWRALKMEMEQANTLNNMSYVLSWLGKFGEARRTAEDALGMRRKSGLRTPVALSLSTLAENEIKALHYDDALHYAQQALDLAGEIGDEFGEGLAHLALAAIQRFRAEQELNIIAGKQPELLRASLKHARQARHIFTEGKHDVEYQLRALYELGTTLREMCRLPQLQQEASFSEAESSLREAAQRALEIHHWQYYLDAALSLAWAYHYREQEDELQTTLSSLQEKINAHLQEYLITSDRFPRESDETVTLVFGQLARMHNLLGVRALERGEFEAAAQQFALTFEYDAIISEQIHEIRRAIRVVYSRLKKLNPQEMLRLFEGLLSAPGSALPVDKKPQELVFWRFLVDSFGSYESYQKIVG